MIETAMTSVWNRLKRALFIGKNVHEGSRLHIGLGSFVWAPTCLRIGDDVYIGKYCTIQCNGSIGNGTLIANNVGVVGRLDHDFRKVGLPMSKTIWIGSSSELASNPKSWIDIGEDVWVGYGATLLSGIRVGRGAIVAAGSVVLEDVDPYDIVMGNPARAVGRRFSTQDQITQHEAAIHPGRIPSDG